MGMTRREFIKGAGAVAALGMIGWPKLSFATLPTDNRFILVILRGALDGLAAVPAYGDRDYAAQRGRLAFARPGQLDGALDLDGFFGLNPALQPLLPLYQQHQMAIIHAVASPYRDRSHFDAQNLLENGTTRTGGTDGWLNRAMQVLKADNSAAIAINQQVPLVLQGALGVESWAPKSRDVNAESDAAQAAAVFLKKDNGPRIAVLEASGWDTHANQGTSNGPLANRLADLGHGLAVLPQALGPVWNKTVVVVVTEFGRTVAENGTGGTDHGTGSAVFVMGGGVRGGKVLGAWPGLSAGNLYQNRDLMPTTDMRSILKTVLSAHLNTPRDGLENIIFPNSATATPLAGLLA